MHSFPQTRNKHHQPGIAIVVVVSLMALLALMVIAFLLLSSTNRNNASLDVSIRQADSIAEQAKETFIADLIGEMKAGAAAVTDTPDGKQSFSVDKPKSMVPERSVKADVKSDTRLKQIVKQSAGGTKFHEISSANFTGKTRASSISTATAGADGRKIAEIRWSAPKLFDPAVTFTNTQVPDWIYTARNGTNPTTLVPANSKSTGTGGAPNPEFIVGRYAYQVYDVSGLLDANVAGNLSVAPPAGAMSRKGSLVWADLSTLPGASGGLSLLADWRRSSTKAMPPYDFIKEWGGLKGWMRTPVAGGQSDNVFLSRRELLVYQKENATDFPAALLPFFTTLSRELNQPSWAPTFDAGAGFDYKKTMDEPTAINRRFAGVRVKAAFTRRDGKGAKVGEPLMTNRFPLSKIQAFADNNSGDVQKYFGLVPAQSAGAKVISWTHANSAGGLIKRLDQVAAENREPDFFETLKAGMLAGSVGNDMVENSLFMDRGRDANTDYQILRVGASIIDQWDVDDDPTIIQYGLTNPIPESVRTMWPVWRTFPTSISWENPGSAAATLAALPTTRLQRPSLPSNFGIRTKMPSTGKLRQAPTASPSLGKATCDGIRGERLRPTPPLPNLPNTYGNHRQGMQNSRPTTSSLPSAIPPLSPNPFISSRAGPKCPRQSRSILSRLAEHPSSATMSAKCPPPIPSWEIIILMDFSHATMSRCRSHCRKTSREPGLIIRSFRTGA